MEIKKTIVQRISKSFHTLNTQNVIGKNQRSDHLDLYLDAETERILKQEAHRFELSSSALVRVLAVIWKEDIFPLTIAELREHIHEIIKRENRKV